MTNGPTSTLYFNLWHEPWIRATRQGNGQDVVIGIGECLANAHTLHALHDSSPLVVAGIHRLLTAILQATYAPESPGDIAAILGEGYFDPARLALFAEQYAERFELFHPTAPFLQTGDVPLDEWERTRKSDLKSVAYLFPELPTGINRIHFQHSTAESHRICPACCARGLVTIPPFASSGGKGFRPSINGVPPVYVLPVGNTIFESLALSLTAPGYQPQAADPSRPGLAAWNGETRIEQGKIISAVGYLESLTFPARRVRLYPLPIPTQEHCILCGTLSPVVVQHILYEMGHHRGEQSGVWDDPFIARRPVKETKGKPTEPLPVRPEAGKALWREYGTLLLTNQENPGLRPKIVQQIGTLIEDHGIFSEMDVVRVRCISIRTDGKAKIFEWLDEALEAPPSLLNDLGGSLLIEDALRRADEAAKGINTVFTRHFQPERERSQKNPSAKTVRFKTLQERMQMIFWQRLALEFRTVIARAADPSTHSTLEREWVDMLVRVGKKAFIETADQIGDRADALQIRVEAQEHCRHMLNKKRKEWLPDDQ